MSFEIETIQKYSFDLIIFVGKVSYIFHIYSTLYLLYKTVAILCSIHRNTF